MQGSSNKRYTDETEHTCISSYARGQNEEDRVGGNPRLKLHVPGPQEGIPRYAPPAPFNSRLTPAELSTRWQNLPSSTASSYEPWPYGIWDR